MNSITLKNDTKQVVGIGYTESATGTSEADFMVWAVIVSTGLTKWSKRYEISGNQYARGGVQTDDGVFLLAGTGGGLMIIKTDSSVKIELNTQ